MDEKQTSYFRWANLLAASLLAFAVAGCGGGGGSGGSTGSAGAAGPGSIASGTAALAASTALNISITNVTISSPPVVRFTVTNQAGLGMPSLSNTDLRFNIAKLRLGTNGEPSAWQNYINRGVNGAVEGSQERASTGFAFGTLTSHGDGTYTYTFATDITNPGINLCPAPCTDAVGKPLDTRYEPGLTHRVTIQQGNGAYPSATGVLDFVPAGGSGARRDIVLTSTCNECHNELRAHGTRVDTRLCVTCHNPGSWVAGTPDTTVDFKVMIHRIHFNIYNSLNPTDRNAPNYLPRALPSVDAGFPYLIGTADFSTPTFTQDARNCSKCHDGSFSAQGDNWKTQPSIDACTSCHDTFYFTVSPDPAKPYQTEAHPAGTAADNSACALCHGPGKVADVVVQHNFPSRFKAASGKFKLNIIDTAPTAAGGTPVITFSVTDPTNGDTPYDIKSHPAFTTGGGVSTLTVKLGWTQFGIADVGNDGSGQNFGQPISINALSAAAVAGSGGTYTVTSPVAIPAAQTGTLRVMMDGHPAGDVSSTGPTSDDITLPPGAFADRLSVKSVFRDFAITGTVAPRRQVVDINKCNVCHDVLSLHGNNRTDEPGVCAVCHNPNGTDKSRRVTGPFIDGKAEEAIDFKTMIHAIHAGQASNGGFREKGIVVYGFGNSANDYRSVVFPGRLSNCTACHTSTSYQLTGIWASPTANGILGNTFNTGASPTDASDNLRISPTAAICSSCHDGATAKVHMELNGASFSATQAVLNGAVVENCAFCHGPGRTFDIKVLHGVN
ncbi:MAG: OmcA/MtrC family decaheme c-type cytochrome [Betaproteobacteria bacterium]|nr:OmcA/MtrC family decaheme c-type cytochrome [Betaproteobacteria bacterium]